ncbi:MAG TPA: His/Gly/Thr/Pro-type tRNA ligase C-terminal domain-containing protein, partial [Caldilinea sp.]|nr:His/Gly/Thr/Pro-type tRNA ligase C-terminal domain-containing protein [Caldilinea sp.]
ADLLGIPIRLTVGAKGLKNGIVEGKLRRNGEMFEFAVDAVVEDVCALVAAEIERINATAAPVPFEDK